MAKKKNEVNLDSIDAESINLTGKSYRLKNRKTIGRFYDLNVSISNIYVIFGY